MSIQTCSKSFNNEIKAKRLYFTKNLDSNKSNMKKTWNLINELSSRNCSKTKNMPDLKIGDQAITTPAEIAEAFSVHFSNVGDNHAAEIPPSELDPEFYLQSADKTFSLQILTVNTVCKLLRTIDEKKSAGLDKIPNKLLKIDKSFI